MEVTKKWLAFILAVVMLFGVFAGCDNVKRPDPTDPPEGTTGSTKPSNQEGDIPDFIVVKSDAVEEVKDAVCLKVGSPYALVCHEQKLIDEANKAVMPMAIGDSVYVPVDFISAVYETKVDWEETVEMNGAKMAPLEMVSKKLSKQFFYEEGMGLIILSDDKINLSLENDLDTLIDITHGFVFERPSQEQIAADISQNAPDHPRVLATAEDFERIRNLMGKDAALKSWVDSLLIEAEKYVMMTSEGEPKPVFQLNDTGELVSTYNIPDRATKLGMAWQLTGDMRYVDAMWYTLEDMCDESKWACWNPGKMLEAAEIMHGAAIAYDWMYDAWTEAQREAIEYALYNCGIEDSLSGFYGTTEFAFPGYEYRRNTWWSNGSNWNAACNSAIAITGMAMLTHEEYGDAAAKAIDFALRAVELGTRYYAPDGGYEEGVMYWSYGTSYLIMFVAALDSAAGTTYGLENIPGFEHTYATPLYSESAQGSFNYGDGGSSRTDTSSLFWFGKKYSNPAINGVRYNELKVGEKLSSYKDILWYDPENLDLNTNLELDYSFFTTQTAMLRSTWTDENQLFVGIHGGPNHNGHGNLDIGTFVLDALGTRWFIELGSDNYELPGYFTLTEEGRWSYYSQRAEGQNTIVINPDSGADQYTKAEGTVTEFVSKPRGSYAIVDLSDAYRGDASAATRGVMLGANRKEIIIQDEIDMRGPSEYYWFAHTKAEIEIAEDGRSVIMTQGSKKLYGEIISDNADLKFTVMDAVSLPTSPVPNTGKQKELSREGIRKLVVHGSGVEEIRMALVFKPILGDELPVCEYTYTELSAWEIPEGELVVPKLKALCVAGEEIAGFDPNNTFYELVLPSNTTECPDIFAEADFESNCTVILPKQIPGTVEIRVADMNDDTMYNVYSIHLRLAKELELEVSGAQDGNPPENCLDKDLTTRWAVQGESWGIFRFDVPKKISSVWIAAWKSAKRNLIFDIEVSEDGENFTLVWSGKSSVTEDILEEFEIPEGTYKAIKLVLHGTSDGGTWNSLLEVEFK